MLQISETPTCGAGTCLRAKATQKIGVAAASEPLVKPKMKNNELVQNKTNGLPHSRLAER